MNKWTEQPVDALVLGMFYLQNYYNVERIRAEFAHATIPVDELVISEKIINPSDIVTKHISQISLAKNVIQSGGVVHAHSFKRNIFSGG